MLYSQRPQRKSVRSAGTRARVPRSVWDGGWDGGQPLSPPRLARSRTELNRDQVLRLFYFTQYSIVIARKVKFTIGDWAEEGGEFGLGCGIQDKIGGRGSLIGEERSRP